MAILSYDIKTAEADLTAVVTNISPTDTPLLTAIGDAKAISTLHEAQNDSNDAPGPNAALDGADFADAGSYTMPERVPNHTQIFAKEVKVSGTAQAVAVRGIKDVYKYQVTKKLKAIATDVEYALLRNGAAVAGGAATPRKMRGVFDFIGTNSADMESAELTETAYNDLAQTVWTAGGNPNLTLVGGKNKRVISGFTASSTKNVDAKAKKLISTVEVYESDFGLQRIVASRIIEPRTLGMFDTNTLAVAWLRRVKHEPLAKTGDSVRGQIIGECTLECPEEKTCGKMINVGAA